MSDSFRRAVIVLGRLREQSRDRAATAGYARPNGADRNRQDLRYLGVVEVEEIAEHDRGPLVHGKLLQSRVDVEPGAEGVAGIDPGRH